MKFQDLNLLDIGNTIQITGVVYSGEGRHLLCFFPGEDLVDLRGLASGEITVLDMNREEWQQFLRQTDIMETEVLTQAGEDQPFVKAILRKSSRQISQHVSWAVYRRDSYACRYCGNDETPLTVDHLVLWEEGGPSTEENLLSACKKCNKTRGNTQYGDWLKHPYYSKVSRNLTAEQREANIAVLGTLDAIPRMVHKQTKR